VGVVQRDPVEGDRVICLRNDREAGVFNGQQGVIAGIEYDDILFRDVDGIEKWVNTDPDSWLSAKRLGNWRRVPGRCIPFDYAYCVSCHKAQGSEWNNVVVIEQRCDLWEHSRWAYTAASRARRKLVWVTG
jgi:exodeoxyribonuclease-5